MAREAVQLARACGVEVLPEGAILPLQAILEGSQAEALESVRTVGAQFAAEAPGHRMSALQDLLAGRPLEVQETFGDAVTKAHRAGLEVPLLEAFYHLLAAIDRTRTAAR